MTKPFAQLIAVTFLILGLSAFPVRAVPVVFLGRVLEDTPEMAPVCGVNVGVKFRWLLNFQTVATAPPAFATATTDCNGLFAVITDADVGVLTFDSAQADVIVNKTSGTKAVSGVFAISQSFANPAVVLNAAGLSTGLIDILNELLQSAAGGTVPALTSVDFVAQGGYGTIKVPVMPPPVPVPMTALLLGSGVVGFLVFRRRRSGVPG